MFDRMFLVVGRVIGLERHAIVAHPIQGMLAETRITLAWNLAWV